MAKRSQIFWWYLLMICSVAGLADNIDQAINAYQKHIEDNKNQMTWFIPFRSFADPKVVGALYTCTNTSWRGCDAQDVGCTKGWLFPIFYVALPIVHTSLEVAATPTVRVLALPYLCYLAAKNSEASDAIDFLNEIKKYLQYKNDRDFDTAKSYYANSSQLKRAFKRFQSQLNDRKLSQFIRIVTTNLATNQYRFNGDFWSVDDYVRAATTLEKTYGTFDFDDQPKDQAVENPELVTCVMCQDKKVAGAFLPCGHFVSCDDCYETLKSDANGKAPACPNCRAPITDLKKIYH
ncbi:MAG TPA: RING finger protein [Myxococcota bacterium]|nr:RING finger protein [Myxococcota bacterium]